MLRRRRTAGRPGDDVRTLVRRELTRFAVPAVAGVVLLALASLLLSVTVARRESMGDAEQNAQWLARSVVQPHLSEGLVEGRTADIVALDRAFDTVVQGSLVVDARVWAPDGTVVYSDDPRLIGETFDPAGVPPLTADGALPVDAARSENRYLDPAAAHVEVVLPVQGADGHTYRFQMIQREDSVPDAARQIWWTFVPILLGTLLLVGSLLLVLSVRMARRLSAALRVRQDLLQHAVEASDLERRRIASDLHDGTVQRLAGAGYRLSGLARRSSRTGGDDADALAVAAAQVRDSVRELRSLLVDIYPPNIERTGLELALADVASSAGPHTRVDVEITDLVGVDAELRTVVYRIAREALANALKHASATSATVRVDTDDGSVRTVVTDDGVGFDVTAVPDGHLGLRIMRDLADSVGGQLTVTSGPGAGTTVTFIAPTGGTR